MTENTKEGPSIKKITITVCQGCKYLLSDLSKTGRNPVRNYHCIHPDVVIKTEFPIVQTPMPIGYSDDTPEWCPYINGKFTKEKIENLLKSIGSDDSEFEWNNSCYDEFEVTDIKFSENKTTIEFDIDERRVGTMGDNKITIRENPFKIKVIKVQLHERFEGGGDEEVIEKAMSKYLNDGLE